MTGTYGFAYPKRTYRITIMERSCPADDFDSENGIGIPENVEPWEADVIETTDPDAALRDAGLSEWDGGNTAYDPDGSHMSPDGTITERFARIEAVPPTV